MEDSNPLPSGSAAVSSQSSLPLLLAVLLVAILGFLAFAYWQLNQRLDSLEARLSELPSATIDAIVAFQNQGSEAPATSGQTSIQASARMGNSNAPIVMVEFSDFNCSFCGRYHNETFGQIKEKYIDTGQLLYVYRDFIGVGGEVSLAAAAAARCVRDQTDDTTYINLVSEVLRSSGMKSIQTIRNLSAPLTISSEQLDACIDEQNHYDAVIQDTRDAQGSGIRGTPGFLIGQLQDDGSLDGSLVAGAQPFEYFDALIQQQLAQLD